MLTGRNVRLSNLLISSCFFLLFHHTTGSVNPVRPSRVVDNTERPSDFAAVFDRQCCRQGRIITISLRLTVFISRRVA